MVNFIEPLTLMRLIFTALLLIAVGALNAQRFFGLPCEAIHPAGCDHPLEGTGQDAFTYVPPPADYVFGGPRETIISLSFTNTPPEAIAAITFAADLIAAQITTSVPILVDVEWDNFESNFLAFAGFYTAQINFPNAPLPDTFYPIALANKFAETDLEPTVNDIFCTFNGNFNWYFGTDGNAPSGTYDLVTVAMHELLHGLGIVSSVNVQSGTGSYGFGGNLLIYDVFCEDGAETALASLESGSEAVANWATSDDLFWNGANGVQGQSGERPRLYAPANHQQGSSISHLNEASYPAGQADALMTPFINQAEAIHGLGPVTVGLLCDMGWCPPSSACPGDFDNDLQVATSDLLIFLSQFGCTGVCEADLTGSGVVGTEDLLVFLSIFGSQCP